MNQRQPVVDFLAPANAQTAPLSEPTQGTLDDPAPGWEMRFTRDRAFFYHGLTALSFVFDMHDVARFFHKLITQRRCEN